MQKAFTYKPKIKARKMNKTSPQVLSLRIKITGIQTHTVNFTSQVMCEILLSFLFIFMNGHWRVLLFQIYLDLLHIERLRLYQYKFELQKFYECISMDVVIIYSR